MLHLLLQQSGVGILQNIACRDTSRHGLVLAQLECLQLLRLRLEAGRLRLGEVGSHSWQQSHAGRGQILLSQLRPGHATVLDKPQESLSDGAAPGGRVMSAVLATIRERVSLLSVLRPRPLASIVRLGLAGLRVTAGREAGRGEGLRPLQEAGVRLGIKLLRLDCGGLKMVETVTRLDHGGMEAAKVTLEAADHLHGLTIDCDQGGRGLTRA